MRYNISLWQIKSVFTQDKKERLLSLLSWATEGKRETSMLGVPGMAPYVNIPNLAQVIFLQRSETLTYMNLAYFYIPQTTLYKSSKSFTLSS